MLKTMDDMVTSFSLSNRGNFSHILVPLRVSLVEEKNTSVSLASEKKREKNLGCDCVHDEQITSFECKSQYRRILRSRLYLELL